MNFHWIKFERTGVPLKIIVIKFLENKSNCIHYSLSKEGRHESEWIENNDWNWNLENKWKNTGIVNQSWQLTNGYVNWPMQCYWQRRKKKPSNISEGVKSDFHGYIYKMKWTDLWKWTDRVHFTIKRWTWYAKLWYRRTAVPPYISSPFRIWLEKSLSISIRTLWIFQSLKPHSLVNPFTPEIWMPILQTSYCTYFLLAVCECLELHRDNILNVIV